MHSERPKLFTILAFLSATGLKDNTIVLSKDIKIICFAMFSFFVLTVKSRYMHSEHSETKKFSKKKFPTYLA